VTSFRLPFRPPLKTGGGFLWNSGKMMRKFIEPIKDFPFWYDK
jgi:hypothetical protein